VDRGGCQETEAEKTCANMFRRCITGGNRKNMLCIFRRWKIDEIEAEKTLFS
ncbi:8280_t:CDS:1, partial [Acaulospora morrowiae]